MEKFRAVCENGSCPEAAGCDRSDLKRISSVTYSSGFVIDV